MNNISVFEDENVELITVELPGVVLRHDIEFCSRCLKFLEDSLNILIIIMSYHQAIFFHRSMHA